MAPLSSSDDETSPLLNRQYGSVGVGSKANADVSTLSIAETNFVDEEEAADYCGFCGDRNYCNGAVDGIDQRKKKTKQRNGRYLSCSTATVFVAVMSSIGLLLLLFAPSLSSIPRRWRNNDIHFDVVDDDRSNFVSDYYSDDELKGSNDDSDDIDNYTRNALLYDVAYVNFIRHGEKDYHDDDDPHLNRIGRERAEYYAKCIPTKAGGSSNDKNETSTFTTTIVTEAYPKPVGSLLAQLNQTLDRPYHGTNYGLSQRAPETLLPLSEASGIPLLTPCAMTDFDCFASTVVPHLLRPNQTVLISWEHALIPKLFRLLISSSPLSSFDATTTTKKMKTGEESTTARANEDGIIPAPSPPVVSILSTERGRALLIDDDKLYAKWPEACDAAGWENPKVIDPEKSGNTNGNRYHNACFDRVWQIQFARPRQRQRGNNGTSKSKSFLDDGGREESSGGWVPVKVRQFNNGFGGSSLSECAEGLRPLFE